VRVIFEIFYRSFWIELCADDELIHEIINNREVFPRMRKMSDDLDSVSLTGAFGKMKQRCWDLMNDYTHSGMRHLACRVSGIDIKPNYDDRQLIKEAKTAFVIAATVAMLILSVHDRDADAEQFLALVLQVTPER
jgi:hypothetical protein